MNYYTHKLFYYKLFNSSGFSKENISDEPELLKPLEYLEIPSLNLVQDRFLSEISLRVNYEDIKDYYYCKIGEYYYIIRDITIISKDTCKIKLETDNFLNHKLNLEYLWLRGSEEDK